MKRPGLARRTPLRQGRPPKRSGWIKRGTKALVRHVRLRARNPERMKLRKEAAYGPGGVQGAFVREHDCCVPGCWWRPIHAHHYITRGAGGNWRHLVPLCSRHHDEFHDRGRETFARNHRVDLAEVARQMVTSGPLAYLEEVA
ncbi:MAG: hypothetical protein AAF604_04795 [Acidobacteriota bacterium]